jgi:hypothetical protein
MGLLKGHSILAMQNDSTSVTMMLQYMGVEPTPELVAEAIGKFASVGFNMDDLGAFLVEKGILTQSEVVDAR